MKNIVIFALYLALGIFMFFVYKEVGIIMNTQRLTSPLPEIPFSLNFAPSETLKGNIISLSGDVKWQSRTATQASQITHKIEIQQGEDILTGKDGTISILIPEKLNINLGPESEINFIQTLPENILIEQKSGIALYENPKKQNVTVRISGLIVKLNSGNTKVTTDPKSDYVTIDVDGNITASYNDLNIISRIVSVAQNKRLIFDKELKTVRVISLQ
jgi:hypothetical protein